MRVATRGLAVACLSFCLSFSVSTLSLSCLAAAQPSDQVVAERVLGPRWKLLSRRAGMIFADTVLATAPQTVATETAATETSAHAVPGATPAVQLSFRVDEAIAGVDPGQVLTIHEWAGAWAMHRPMSKGQHILIFLYPPSRLGLTSPVGGSLGQVALDQTGKNVSQDVLGPPAAIALRNASSPRSHVTGPSGSVSVVQLGRAIRSAREE